MFLAVDVGNTHVVLGLYNKDKLVKSWRLASNRERTEDEMAVLIENLLNLEAEKMRDIQDIAIASVVPAITETFCRLSKKYLNIKPMLIQAGEDYGMPILMENPQEVGADRIINGIAGYETYGGPLIIVDFGTANTFDCISVKGEYLGGVISAGINISMEALFHKAAKLPRIDLVLPEHALGKNTKESIQAGVFYGFAGQVDGIVKRLWQEIGSQTNVVATGGLADMLFGVSETINIIDPLLTINGLNLLWQRKQNQK